MKQLQIILFYILIFQSTSLYTQVGANGKPLEAGLYKTFEDFKKNTPFRKGVFVKTEKYIVLGNRYEDSLLEQDSLTQLLKIVSEPYWGFATKEEAFIYTEEKKGLNSKKELSNFLLLGRYCVYQEQLNTVKYGVKINMGKWRLIDTETGENTLLNQKSLIPILKQHPAIFAEYQNEKIPMEMEEIMKLYIKYLKKVNEELK